MVIKTLLIKVVGVQIEFNYISSVLISKRHAWIINLKKWEIRLSEII
jgi:hypothetical protein